MSCIAIGQSKTPDFLCKCFASSSTKVGDHEWRAAHSRIIISTALCIDTVVVSLDEMVRKQGKRVVVESGEQ